MEEVEGEKRWKEGGGGGRRRWREGRGDGGGGDGTDGVAGDGRKR